MFGHSQLGLIQFILMLASGITYILATIPIVCDSDYLKSGRIIKIFPLFFALITLLLIKLGSMDLEYDSRSFCLFLADIIPGLGKRIILLYALATGSSTTLGRALCPFEVELAVKSKKD